LQKGENRRFKRIDLRAPVRYQVRGRLDFDNGVSDNISEGGLAFSAIKFVPPSTPVMLEINLLQRMLCPIGRVSWCQPLPHSDRSRLGVEFVEFSSSDRDFLSDYINMKSG